TCRHLTDDGAITYLNEQVFHRFNMPARPVNYLTQASTNVGDAVDVGPFTTSVNLLAGDNVIAVEVHQSGTASSDVTFGAAFAIGTNTPPTIACPSDILASNTVDQCSAAVTFSPSASGNPTPTVT